jgi:hypothetical protein
MTPRNGSALLIALLLTSILILITVGLSRLVTSETRQISDLIKNGRAEYLAEGGTELGQLIYYNLEEDQISAYEKNYELSLGTEDQPKDLKFNLQSTTNHIPILKEEIFEQVANNPLNKPLLFQPLLPGESIEIFLSNNATNFEIKYYITGIDPSILGTFSQLDLDVLLFKLSGIPRDTEAENYDINFITEYFPAAKNANNPSIIGTAESGVFNNGDFFEYSSGETLEDTEVIVDPETGEITFTEYTQDNKKFEDFLKEHKQNVLSLSNAANLATINNPESAGSDFNQLKEILGSIYYRICSPTCASINSTDSKNLVSPFVVIDSTATYQNTTKNLTTQLTRPNAFSVFDFAIYQTGEE